MESCHHLWFAQQRLYFNVTSTHPASSSLLSPPLVELPRRQPSVLTVNVTADVWPGNSCQSPSPLRPQQSVWPETPLRGNHKIWSLTDMAPPQMCTVKLPEQQQDRRKPLSFQVDFYCYYSTIRSHSTSLYLITVINLKPLLFDVSTKSFPELNHARLNQQALVSFPYRIHVNNLPAHSCQKLQVKASGRCSAVLTSQDKHYL